MSKKILIIVTNHDHIDATHPTGLWFEEFASPYHIFQQQGYQVTVASPKGGQAPIDPNSAPQDAAAPEHQAALQALANTVALSSVQAADFDAVFLPGGHGTMFDLPAASVGQVVGQFADANKLISAVCHGLAGLVGATRADGTPVVQGYRLTGFTNEEETAAQLVEVMPFLVQDKMTELGAEFIAAPMWSDHIEVDRQLVTGQNPQSGSSAAHKLVELLEKAPITA